METLRTKISQAFKSSHPLKLSAFLELAEITLRGSHHELKRLLKLAFEMGSTKQELSQLFKIISHHQLGYAPIK